MALSLFSMSKTVPLHNDGKIVPGGLLWFYSTGTTTLKDTYADAEGLIPNQNPVVLDGAGRADIFLADDAAYDVFFTDPGGVVIWTLINVISATSASTGMATAPVANTIQIGGVQPALQTPIGRGNLVLYCNNGTLLEIRGIDAGYDGQSLFIYSIGLGQIDLVHQSPSAAAENRIVNPFAGTISLAPRLGSVHLIYDATSARWRTFQHNQGDWIPYPVKWQSTGGGVNSIGDGLLEGSYYVDGRGCSYRVWLYWGTTTVSQMPYWAFSLPPLPILNQNTVSPVQIHNGAVGESAGAAGIQPVFGGTEMWTIPFLNPGAVNGCGPDNPHHWVNIDQLFITGTLPLSS